jgi:heme exporter protein D
MNRLWEFLAMGGYARFVWPAFILALLLLVGMAGQSLLAYRRAERRLAALGPRPRARGGR